jgi:hypothetical protein
MNGNIIKTRKLTMEKSYNFKMQMGCSVLSWAATLSLAFKAPENR